MKSVQTSTRGLENFSSSSFEVTTKNNDSRSSPRLSGFSVSAWSDQEGGSWSWGCGGSRRSRHGCPRRGPPPSSIRSPAQRAGASRGRRAAAAAAIHRLRSCRPEIRCPHLPPGTLKREGARGICKEQEGRGCEEAASERARGEAGERKKRRREDSERAAGEGSAQRPRRRRRRRGQAAAPEAGQPRSA